MVRASFNKKMLNEATIQSTKSTAKPLSNDNKLHGKQHSKDALLRKYREYFRIHDTDGNGTLDKKEFMKMVENCGVDLDVEDMKRAYNAADTEGDGIITFRKFLQAYTGTTPLTKPSNRATLRRRSSVDERMLSRKYQGFSLNSGPNIPNIDAKDYLLKVTEKNDNLSPLLASKDYHGSETSTTGQNPMSSYQGAKKPVSKQVSDDTLLRKRRGHSEVIGLDGDAKQLAKYMSELQTSTHAQVHRGHQEPEDQLKMKHVEPLSDSKQVHGHRNLTRTRAKTITTIPSEDPVETRHASSENSKRSKKRVVTRSSTIAAIPTAEEKQRQQSATISSDEILREFQKYLCENDKRVDGKLNWNDFLKLIDDMGIKLKAKQITEVYQTLNEGVDGGNTYKAFSDAYTNVPTPKASTSESKRRVRNNTVRRRSLSAKELSLNNKPLVKTNRERAISGSCPPVAPTRDSVRSWLTRHQGKSSEVLKNLTDTEYKECFRCFWISDNDSDGKLSAYEFSKMLERLGMKLTNRDLHKAFSAVDTNGDGRITFNDFLCAYLSKTILQVLTPEVMKERYCSVSTVTGGYVLTGIECLKLLSDLGNELDERKLGKVLRLMKVDSQGFVTLANFYHFLGYSSE